MNYVTFTSPNTAYLSFGGYFYDRLEYIFLSSTNNTIFPYVCSIEYFTGNKTLSSSIPPISGYPYSNYFIQGENKLVIFLSNLPAPGLYDIIVGNAAGYSKLSDRDYLIDVPQPPPTPAFYAVTQGETVPVTGSNFYVLAPDAITNFNVSGDGYTYNVNIISEGEYSYAIVTLTNGEQYTAQLNTLTTIMIDGIERTVYLTYYPNGDVT